VRQPAPATGVQRGFPVELTLATSPQRSDKTNVSRLLIGTDLADELHPSEEGVPMSTTFCADHFSAGTSAMDTDLASAIGELNAVVRRMERSDRVAKLAGLVSRVQSALAEGSDLKAPLHALAVATERGLNGDPWMQLHCLVQHLTNQVEARGADPECPDVAVEERTESSVT
jgi:hypothetical protein